MQTLSCARLECIQPLMSTSACGGNRVAANDTTFRPAGRRSLDQPAGSPCVPCGGPAFGEALARTRERRCDDHMSFWSAAKRAACGRRSTPPLGPRFSKGNPTRPSLPIRGASRSSRIALVRGLCPPPRFCQSGRRSQLTGPAYRRHFLYAGHAFHARHSSRTAPSSPVVPPLQACSSAPRGGVGACWGAGHESV